MRYAFAAVGLALVLCSPAEAATTVARSGDFSLHAAQRDDRLCITLRRDRRYRGEACGRIPRSPHRPLEVFPDVGWNDYAAAVPPSVRFAETESRSGRRERHRTSGARGFPARFVILPAPPAAVFVRYYGARGRLLGITGGPAGYISLDDNETAVSEGVGAHTEPLLVPMPDDPGRLATIACVDVETALAGASFCDDRSAGGLVLVSACEEPPPVGALVAAGVAAVRLTLGSGAEVTLPGGDMPAAFGERRAAAGRLPAGEAVRHAVALDAAGAVVGRTTVGMAPGQPCAGEDQGGDGFGGPFVPPAPASPVEVAAAGGESLVAADQGERLCVGLRPLPSRVCPLPPVDSDRPRLHWRNGVVAGALSRDAARITLRVGGDDVTVGTTAGPDYRGRWAGRVRFFAAHVGEREATGAVVRNARGRIIGLSRRILPRRPPTVTVLAERDGRGVRLVRQEGDPPCLIALTAGAPRFCSDPGQSIDGPYLPYRSAVSVPCAPRLATAYGRMPDELKPPVVLLAGGGAVPARRIRLPGHDGWVAFVPDAGVRGLRAGRRSVPLALPPANEQCGYSLHRNF